MRVIFIILLLSTFSFANYTIYYSGLKLGIIENLKTIHQNYLYIKVTNPVARLLLGKKYLIFYNDAYVQSHNKETIKYKKDKYHIIKIIQEGLKNQLMEGTLFVQPNKFIEITQKNNIHFNYISKGKQKAYGELIIKDNKLISLIEKKNHIKIIQH